MYKILTRKSLTEFVSKLLLHVGVVSAVDKNSKKWQNFLKQEDPNTGSSTMVTGGGRTLWLVRHAEREDNVNPDWQLKATNPLGLRPDNSPLSARGIGQAEELAKRFAGVPIDHVFASPFERTMQTATILLGDRCPQIPICVEPGLGEAMYYNESPPSFEEAEELKRRFPTVDARYEQIYEKLTLPTEEKLREEDDAALVPRLRRTLHEVLRRANGAGCSIVFVTHSPPIGALHALLNGGAEKWHFVGQATVTKFVESGAGTCKFCAEFTADASHLSDPTNLRPYG